MDTPLIIAEAGVNHNGDLARAREMVRAAAEAGADFVKFQGFRTEELVAASAATAAYQDSNAGESSQAALLHGLELSLDDFAALAEDCRAAGIRFLCTPFDAAMAGPLIEMGMDRIKIPSGELTNTPYLAKLARYGFPVLLSTGMGTMDEVRRAIRVLRDGGAGEITVLHCTSLYPASMFSINLNAMVDMRETLGVPVGYSDHSLGDHVAIAAVALGAAVIEKHFTLDRALPGPDHAASLEPGELQSMVRRVRDVATALGDGVKAPAPGEMEIAQLVRRSWHAVRDLSAGTLIGENDVTLKRPADGLPPDAPVIGRRLTRAVAADQPLRAEHLAEDAA